MPTSFVHHITNIISREQAQLLWSSRLDATSYTVTPELHAALQRIHDNLADRSNDWGQYIAHVVDWSPEMCKYIQLSSNHPKKIHINSLEFVVVS